MPDAEDILRRIVLDPDGYVNGGVIDVRIDLTPAEGAYLRSLAKADPLPTRCTPACDPGHLDSCDSCDRVLVPRSIWEAMLPIPSTTHPSPMLST